MTRVAGKWTVLSLGLYALAACSRDVATGRRCSDANCTPAWRANAGEAGSSNEAAGSGLASTSGRTAIGTRDDALTLHVKDVAGMTIEIVTLACAGDCAEVEAVARGGNPPYAIEWEDGSTNAARRVCLDASAELAVRATDTAIATAEFSYDAHTVVERVIAAVLGCSDAGITGTDDACSDIVENPSFEGRPPGVGLGDPESVPPGWSVCAVSPDINPSFALLPASAGATYLGMIGTSSELAESAGAALCAPLAANTPRYFSVDVAVSAYAVGPAHLQLWGGSASCGMDELLWTSPTIEDVDQWHTFCGELKPSQSFAHLVLWPEPTTFAGAYVLVDNFRARDRCD